MLVPLVMFSTAANAHPVPLGPKNSGAESDFTDWYSGIRGGGSVSVENDPKEGHNNFSIGITNLVPDQTNWADLRSHIFSLNEAANGQRPLTFSFSYKLSDKVNPGDNIAVYLRFFDSTGTKFYDQKPVFVGSDTHDSEMYIYKTLAVSNIVTPPGAVTADVWVTANLFQPWTLGTAEFDDFSVITTSPVPWRNVIIGVAIVAIISGVTLWLFIRGKGSPHRTAESQ